MHLMPLIAGVLSIAFGCGKKTEITNAPGCAATISGTGSKKRVADANKPSSCWGVVLVCNYCEYKLDGIFTKSVSRPCGVCIGSDF
jgi:hypothetical protein